MTWLDTHPDGLTNEPVVADEFAISSIGSPAISKKNPLSASTLL
jgi:hypothetical protein